MTAPLLRQIKASAGSGKTYDLTRRFLAHLSTAKPGVYVPSCGFGLPCAGDGRGEDCGWGDILAVTFTNSAAAEMKDRVIHQLKELALSKKKLPGLAVSPLQAALWVDIILRQLSALNIRTIDSFLHLVVRMSALDLELPPDFQPVFSSGESLVPLLDACIEEAWQGDQAMQDLLRDACESLLYHAEIEGFMVGKRIVGRVMDLMDAALTGQLRHMSSGPEIQQHYDRIAHEYRQSATRCTALLQTEGLKVHATALKAMARAATGDAHVAGSAYLHKASLADCLVKASAPPSPFAERAYLHMQDAAVALMGDGKVLKRALQWAPFVALTQKVAQGLELFQQAEGKIPSVRIPLLAHRVLTEGHGVSGALCRMGTRLTHMMIDEFQDTSRVQWQALYPLVEEALSRGGSLTWVGDVKQAIYSWRGGDSTLFDEVKDDAGLLEIVRDVQKDNLPTNWRSRAEIVHFNNVLFALLADPHCAVDVLESLLPKGCPQNILGHAVADLYGTFAACGQIVPERPASRGGCVRVDSLMADDSEALDVMVREQLCRLLLEDIGPRRPWSEVTILVRSNGAATKVAAWLMAENIAVVTENSLLLAEHPLVVQTVAFLAFLDTPQDDLAFWTFVTGTIFTDMCGLQSEELHSWAAARSAGSAQHSGDAQPRLMSLFRHFKADFPLIWQQWLAPFDATAGLMTPYDTVQEYMAFFQLWERFPTAATFLRRFLEVVYRAEEGGHATLGTFLEHWNSKGAEEKLPMPENMDAVRIMTIHKSKGLQFPVVIMPWTSFTSRSDSTPVHVEVDGLHVLAPRCKEMGDSYYEAMSHTARESLHLLYVAFTRAVDELHVFHTRTSGLLQLAGLAPALDILWKSAGFSLPLTRGKALVTRPVPVQQNLLDRVTGAKRAGCSPVPSALPVPLAALVGAEQTVTAEAPWRPMQWLPQLKIFRNPLQALVFDARQKGILTHACLEYFQWTGHLEADVHRAVEQGMHAFPLADSGDFSSSVPDREMLTAEIRENLLWFASLPEAALWLSHGVPEQSIVDSKGALHRVDLLVSSPAGRVAVDYKTGLPTEQDVQQMQRYLTLLTDMDRPDQNKPDYAAPYAVLVYLNSRQCRTVRLHGVTELTTPLGSAPEAGNSV